jgi:hypothetical protein
LELAYSIDEQLKEKSILMDKEFDTFALKQKHEEWIDRFHQKLARSEMELREWESQIPIIQKKIEIQEQILEKHKAALMEIYEWVEGEDDQNKQIETKKDDNMDYIFEGWLIEANKVNKRRYYKLTCASAQTHARLYGYETSNSLSPICVVEIPKRSVATVNSRTNEYEVKNTIL